MNSDTHWCKMHGNLMQELVKGSFCRLQDVYLDCRTTHRHVINIGNLFFARFIQHLHLYHCQHSSYFFPMQLSQHQIYTVFSVFTMCLRQIPAALAGSSGRSNNQALDNRNNGENTIKIHVDAPAVTTRTSTENNEPSLIAKTTGGDSSASNITSKGSSNLGGSNKGGKSEEEIREEKMEVIRRNSEINAEEAIKRHAAARAKGNEYVHYNSNEIDEY